MGAQLLFDYNLLIDIWWTALHFTLTSWQEFVEPFCKIVYPSFVGHGGARTVINCWGELLSAGLTLFTSAAATWVTAAGRRGCPVTGLRSISHGGGQTLGQEMLWRLTQDTLTDQQPAGVCHWSLNHHSSREMKMSQEMRVAAFSMHRRQCDFSRCNTLIFPTKLW